jgi:hypothetical protein
MNKLDDKLISTARLILYPLKASHAEGMFYGLNDASSYDFTPDIPPLDVAALAERYKRLESRRSPDGQEVWLNWVIAVEGLGFVRTRFVADADEFKGTVSDEYHYSLQFQERCRAVATSSHDGSQRYSR